MRIFVAGATGVIGRALLPRLLEAGHKVTGMTRDPERARRLADGGIEPATCDVYDADGLRKALRAASPEVVIHQLTALPDAIDPRRIKQQLAENDRIRVEGTRNLIHAAQQAGARRIVAQSIAFAYAPTGGPVKSEDDPLWLDPPAEWRRTAEAVASLEQQVASAAGMEGIVLRYGYFYGPGSAYDVDGSMADVVRARGLPVAGGGRGVFSFIHVDDAAAATVAAVEKGRPGVYNVVDDEPQRLCDWLPAYAAAIGAPKPRRIPGFLARLLAGRYGHYLMTRQRGASNARARRELGWSPRFPSLQAGLAARRVNGA
jgi:nucleoside-diphosphate-sugar epimerase